MESGTFFQIATATASQSVLWRVASRELASRSGS